MPCDQIRLITTEIKDCDPETFREAAKALGHRIKEEGTRVLIFDETDTFIGELRGNQLVIEAGPLANQYKKEYSAATIIAENRKKGWRSVRKGNEIFATK